jgi:hypothetical protein
MTYNPLVPTGFIPLNQDYANVQANFNQINNQWLVDHVPLTTTSGTPPNGYHLNVHLVTYSSTVSNPPNNQPVAQPTATPGIGGAPGYGQLWNAQINDGINPDETLYFLTGGNRNMQLTRNFVPTAEAKGATFLPGGIIMNWGFDSVGGSGGNKIVTLQQSCPANFFSAVALSATSGMTVRAVSTPGAGLITQVEFNTNIAGSFYWWVLGN